MKPPIVIGSRGSELALWQANFVKSELDKIGVKTAIKIITTQGDKIQNLSFDKLEGKGFFTKEIEEALLNNEIDLAVHSHKDLTTDFPEGLTIAAVSDREDPSELLLIRRESVDDKQKFFLKQNAIVGTSSARRKSQLLTWRNDIKLDDLRGNVPTRIQKLRDKKYDAILIAQAGVSRLRINLDEFHCERLDPREFIPAPSQGVLALQIRKKDKELFDILQKLNNKEVQTTTTVERKILNLFDGGCQLPLGVYCESDTEEDSDTIVYKTRIAKADKWDNIPRYFYFESKNLVSWAERMVEKINAVSEDAKIGKTRSVFISRNEKPDDLLKKVLESHHYKITCHSLISIKQIPIKHIPLTEWIFFPSKNAIKHFFEQKPVFGNVKFGAVSKPTADELRKHGRRADFIGTGNDTRLTGKKFSAMVGVKKVLFPQSKESLRSIQQQLKKDQVIDLVVYETLPNVKPATPYSSFDILIFTSPSNAEAFLKRNSVGENQKIIAMGEATANYLKRNRIKVTGRPATFDDLGLVQAVFSL